MSHEPSSEELRQALETGDLVFHYQPKVSFLTGAITGAEALLRWQRPDGTIIPPDRFIPVAEASGLIRHITETMFPRLVEDFQAIRARDDQERRVALNVSAQDLDAPRLLALIQQALDAGAMDGEHLELEVTESAMLADSDAVLRRLTEMVSAGISLSMDDFGTGFSSLHNLNRLPFTAIKMDQSFVLTLLSSPKSATLLKSNIAMAQMLGMSAVVEGVESQLIYDSLLHSGCNEAQGFWISRPLALHAYLDLLQDSPRWPASPVGLMRMAQVSHLWQQKLVTDIVFAALRSEEVGAAIPETLPVDYEACALAGWYGARGRCFAEEQSFHAVERPHRRMHALCAEILANLGGPADPQRLRLLVRELSHVTGALLATLEDLEMCALMEELR